MRLLRSTLLLVLLLPATSCDRSGPDTRSLVRTVSAALASQPELQYRVVGFEAGTSVLEVSMKSTPGTQNVFLDLSSLELGGKAPAEHLPMVLGPVDGGEDARALLHFTDVPWSIDEHLTSSRSSKPQLKAAFAYRLRAYWEPKGAGEDAKGDTAESSLSMPVWVDADAPVYARIAEHLTAKR